MCREYYFQRADEAAAIVSVDGLGAVWVELFELGKKHPRRLPLEFFAKFWLRWNGRKDIVVDDRIDIESGSAAQDRNAVLVYDAANGFLCKPLILRNGEGSLRRSDIKEMMRYAAHLFFGDLPGSDIEARIDLS